VSSTDVALGRRRKRESSAKTAVYNMKATEHPSEVKKSLREQEENSKKDRSDANKAVTDQSPEDGPESAAPADQADALNKTRKTNRQRAASGGGPNSRGEDRSRSNGGCD
jgi:hypothetical protein